VATFYVAGVPDTALVVLIPEAEEIVAPYRLQHDPVSGRGVPAHVTVLFPFVSPVDPDSARRVGETCVQHAPFAVSLVSVERFPGLVVWLRPDPTEPFAAMIAAARAAFPQYPPYGGTITEPIPHLTIADGVDERTAATLEAELTPTLPIRSHVDELVLLVEDDTGRWSVDGRWPLGQRANAP
jgi:2'-5' RNA ligase superfamily